MTIKSYTSFRRVTTAQRAPLQWIVFLDEAGNSNDIHDVYDMNFRIDATLPRFQSAVAFVSSSPLKQGDRVEIFLTLENPDEDDQAVTLTQCEVNGRDVNSHF